MAATPAFSNDRESFRTNPAPLSVWDVHNFVPTADGSHLRIRVRIMIAGVAQIQAGKVLLHDDVQAAMPTQIDGRVDANLIGFSHDVACLLEGRRQLLTAGVELQCPPNLPSYSSVLN